MLNDWPGRRYRFPRQRRLDATTAWGLMRLLRPLDATNASGMHSTTASGIHSRCHKSTCPKLSPAVATRNTHHSDWTQGFCCLCRCAGCNSVIETTSDVSLVSFGERCSYICEQMVTGVMARKKLGIPDSAARENPAFDRMAQILLR